MRNNLKSILQNKQKIISRETGYPSQKSGRDGDFQVRQISGQGIFLFYKWNSKWYSTRLTIYRPSTAEHKTKVKVPVGVTPTSIGELTLKKNKLSIKKDKLRTNDLIAVDSSGNVDTNTIKFKRSNADSSSAGTTDDLFLWNRTGNSSISLLVSSNSEDAYINYVYQLTGETTTWHGWCVGMDSSDSRAFKWVTFPQNTANATTPSSSGGDGTTRMELSPAGGLALGSVPAHSTNSVSSHVVIADSSSGALEYRTITQLKATMGISDVDIIDWTSDQGIVDIHAANYTNTTYTGGTNLTLDGTEFNVDDAFLTNDASDTMAGTLTVDFIQVGDKEGTPSSITKQILSYAGNSGAPVCLDFYKSRGSPGSPTIVQQHDYTGTQRYFAYDSNSYAMSAAIRGDIDASPTDGEVPGMLNFLTAPASSLISRMVITSGGEVGIGTWSTYSKPHNVLSVDGTIGLEERASASTDATTYGQVWVKNTDPNELWFTDGDGADFKVSPTRFTVTTSGNGYRMGSVNTYYVGNQTLGTGVTAGDFGMYEATYAVYNSVTTVNVHSWRWVGGFSSSVDYELELWDVTIPSNGTAAAATAAKIGDTQSISATSTRFYTMGQTDLTHSLDAGHSLYVLIRYTSGSGSKYTYGSVSIEMADKD